MIQKNPFLKYMMKDEKKDIVHSSAYAKAQSGETIGVASAESYQVRVNINQHRQMVRGYRDSKLVTEASKNAPRAKTYTLPEQNGGDKPVGRAMGVGVERSGGVEARKPVMPKRPGISIK